jgi:hypothetical protein
MIGCSNVSPHLIRGVRNAIKELEILHKEHGSKCTKIYSPREDWGYPPVTDQDRANMLGLNLAKLLNIKGPKKYA